MAEHDNTHVGADEARDAADLAVGTGTLATAPFESSPASVLARYPVVLAALALLLPVAGAAVTAWAQGQTVTAILTTAVTALIAVLTPLVHNAVTPTADPRLDAQTRLTVE